MQSLAKMKMLKMSRLVLTEGAMKQHADKIANEMSPLKNKNDRNTTTGYATYGQDRHPSTKCTKQHITITVNMRAKPKWKERDQVYYFFKNLKEAARSVSHKCTLLTANSEYLPQEIKHKDKLPEVVIAFILVGSELSNNICLKQVGLVIKSR